MSYQAMISRSNPALLVFLLDQSGSMKEPFGGAASDSGTAAAASKADGLANALNETLGDLVMRCSKGIKTQHYFDLAVLGYGAEQGLVAPALGGRLGERALVSVTEVGDFPLRLEQRQDIPLEGGNPVMVRRPVWCDPVAGADTPMCKALLEAHRLAEAWITQHPNAFPPIVINLTDGEATDDDPLVAARKLTSLETGDGQVLLFNCLISSTQASPVLFPDSPDTIPDGYGKKLFEMSSPIPEPMREMAGQDGFPLTEHSRGMVFQAGKVELTRFLDIGTQVAVLR